MCCGYHNLQWNQLGGCTKFTVVLFWWLVPIGPIVGLTTFVFAIAYAMIMLGLPMFMRFAKVAGFAIHPFGRTIVADASHRPGSFMYFSWVISFFLFGIWMLPLWIFAGFPIFVLMAIFYRPYLRKAVEILRLMANPLTLKPIGDEDAERYERINQTIQEGSVSSPATVIYTQVPQMPQTTFYATQTPYPTPNVYYVPEQPGMMYTTATAPPY